MTPDCWVVDGRSEDGIDGADFQVRIGVIAFFSELCRPLSILFNPNVHFEIAKMALFQVLMAPPFQCYLLMLIHSAFDVHHFLGCVHLMPFALTHQAPLLLYLLLPFALPALPYLVSAHVHSSSLTFRTLYFTHWRTAMALGTNDPFLHLNQLF